MLSLSEPKEEFALWTALGWQDARGGASNGRLSSRHNAVSRSHLHPYQPVLLLHSQQHRAQDGTTFTTFTRGLLQDFAAEVFEKSR